jgi:hypothetical protein
MKGQSNITTVLCFTHSLLLPMGHRAPQVVGGPDVLRRPPPLRHRAHQTVGAHLSRHPRVADAKESRQGTPHERQLYLFQYTSLRYWRTAVMGKHIETVELALTEEISNAVAELFFQLALYTISP